MNVSEVLDVEGSFDSTPLKTGDKIVIQKFNVKHVDKYDADCAEITTTEGLRHSFGKAIVGQAKSEHWIFAVEKCIAKDASDGLDAYVVEKAAEGSGRAMLSLSMYPQKVENKISA
jgi:hypothetical protein